jgi:DNA-binding PadR family transcriptional regulator
MLLEDTELLDSSWEPGETCRPPRHFYRLTPTGLKTAREYVRAHARPSHSARLAGAEG